MKHASRVRFVDTALLIVHHAPHHAQESETDKKDADDKKPAEELVEKLSVTEHTATINGKEIKYTATAGTLVMKDDEGKPKASIFFIAYTKNGVDDLGKRPITFAFNGGPGSSSVWLHLGMLGPKRVKLPDDASPLPPPYELTANPYSLLDITDLVFIDPVSTGFSRPAKGEDKDQFHGYEEDLRSVGQFIHDYVTKYGRWRSPKFLIGESYGGLRAAGLSGYLRDRYNMPLNGILMVSPAINFQTIGFAPGNDLPYILFVPGYAATAWYHKSPAGRLAGAVARGGRQAGHRIRPQRIHARHDEGPLASDDERNAVAEKLARFTGLSKEYVLDVQPADRHVARSARSCCANAAARSAATTAATPASTPTAPAKAPSTIPARAVDLRPVHGRDQRLPAQRPQSRRRPRLRDPHRPGAAVELRPLHHALPRRLRHAPPNHVGHPVHETLRRRRLLRPGHAARHRQVQRRAHATAAAACRRTSTSASTKAAT